MHSKAQLCRNTCTVACRSVDQLYPFSGPAESPWRWRAPPASCRSCSSTAARCGDGGDPGRAHKRGGVQHVGSLSTQGLLDILRAREADRHYGLHISLVGLAEHSPGVVDVLFQSARPVLALLEEAVGAAQEQLQAGAEPMERPLLCVKAHVHPRLAGAALLHDGAAAEACPRIGAVTAAHVDQLVTLSGTVVKTGLVRVLEARRLYECSKCKHR